MKKEKDEELDNLFKKGMEDPVGEPAFRDSDWNAMEQLLDQRKRRAGIVYWLPFLGSAAALLLLFLGWMFFKPGIVKNTKPEQVTAIHNSKNNGTSGGSIQQTADSSKIKTLSPANYAKNPGISRRGQNSKSFLPLSAGGDRRDTTGNRTKITAKPVVETIAATNTANNTSPNSISNQAVIANNNVSDKKGLATKKDLSTADDKKDLPAADNKKDFSAIGNPAKNLASMASKQKDSVAANSLATVATVSPLKVKSTVQPKLGSRPRFALGVLASSDLNGVNSSFQQSRIGGNFGLALSVGLSKKWTISTGVSYDIKPYLTNFSNYHTDHQFNTTPSSVSANCRMLEIPVVVNYQVYSQRGNKITIGSGLSSYFMLREDYTFNYSNPYAAGPAGFSVVNQNRNILSIVNLNATYEHPINSNVGVVIQPYLKIPLSNVGASQVRLQTTGVAVGLNWNLNSFSKPK
jgi:hypothetical protein